METDVFIPKSLLAQTRLEVYKNALDNFEILQDSSVSHCELSSGGEYRESERERDREYVV